MDKQALCKIYTWFIEHDAMTWLTYWSCLFYDDDDNAAMAAGNPSPPKGHLPQL